MIRTSLLLAALVLTAPVAVADAYLAPLIGKGADPAAYGYTVRKAEAGPKVVVSLELTPAAAKAFGHGDLTLTRGGRTVVETTVTIVKDSKGNGTLKLTIDPAAIDGGELVIWSAAIEGPPPAVNFGGFRVPVADLLRVEKDPIDRTPSDRVVRYKLDGRDVRYFILADGRVYPGLVRDGEYVVWHRAEPLLVSEYPFGGPQSRLPLVDAREVDYRTEPPPKGLERIVGPK